MSFRLLSGDRDFVVEQLEKGAAELGLLVASSVDSGSFDFFQLPAKDTWGVLMRADDMLAEKQSVALSDLVGKPLLLPYRAALGSDLMAWFGVERESLDISATYDLAYNASRLAKEGFGYAVTLDGIVDAGHGSGLAFRPLSPQLETSLFLVWKRGHSLSRASHAFLERVRLAS